MIRMHPTTSKIRWGLGNAYRPVTMPLEMIAGQWDAARARWILRHAPEQFEHNWIKTLLGRRGSGLTPKHAADRLRRNNLLGAVS